MASDAKKEALARYRVRTSTKNGFPVIKAMGAKGKVLGEMTLEKPDSSGNRTVRMVEVDLEARRQGIARKLWETAQKKGLNPAHSIQRSVDGEAWAKKMGGARPERPGFEVSTPRRSSAGPVVNARQTTPAAEIAKMNAQRSTASVRPGLNFGAANMGVGALNILGFLPTLIEAGKIIAGTHPGMLQEQREVQRMR